jgi:uncharacterized membrane protein YeaQ/YmgE (transglycosylase-associated protein family)
MPWLLIIRLSQAALLGASLLIGLAFISELPPFEGFDETAHYSYIQQVAETGTWPRFGDPISAEVDQYLQLAPSSASLHARWSYHDFFSSPGDVIDAGRLAVRYGRDGSRSWHPGGSANWEAQQPPLYYVLMAPAFLISKGWSLGAQLFLLRGISYLCAWAGLCLTSFTPTANAQRTFLLTSALILAPALWPNLFPMWYPAMARLGNDSLVILVAACGWLILKKIFETESGLGRYVVLGLVFGLGQLTKATFLPITLATITFLCFQLWQARRTSPIFRNRLYGLLGFLLIVGASSGWWYLDQYFETGSALGANDVIVLNQSGGLLNGLRQNASFALFWSFPFSLANSFLWVGTWSFVVLPPISTLPLIIMTLLLAAGYVGVVRRSVLQSIDCVPAITFAILLSGLCYHALIFIAAYKAIGGPGWYLHSFAPILAPLVGYGLARNASLCVPRVVMSILTLYPLVFLPVMMGISGLFFAGCGLRYQTFPISDISSALSCASDINGILRNLSVLSYPEPAVAFFLLGWILMMFGIATSIYSLWKLGSSRATTVTMEGQHPLAWLASSCIARVPVDRIQFLNKIGTAVGGALLGNWLLRRGSMTFGHGVFGFLSRAFIGATVALLMASLVKLEHPSKEPATET